MDDAPLPASTTKHLGTLHHRLPRSSVSLSLRQLSADSASASGSTGTTGTTLWLGGQVLAAYLVSTLQSSAPSSSSTTDADTSGIYPRPRAIELGAGVGYLSLTLANLGYDVVATDISPVVETVLTPNVEAGTRTLLRAAGSDVNGGNDPVSTIGKVTVTHLDWMNPNIFDTAFDVVVTTDTLYAPHLVEPLWSTLARLCSGADAAPLTSTGPRTVLFALERRDSRLIDHALQVGEKAGFKLQRVAQSRVGKAIAQAGWKWEAKDWEGVEVWRAKWRGVGGRV